MTKNNLYHKIRKINPELAREIVREKLTTNKGNVSKTAREMGISRLTVRRARDGDLKDKSRAPKNPKRKYSNYFIELIKTEARNTNFRYRRLSKYLYQKYSIEIPESSIKYILKDLKPKKKRSKNNNTRKLYDYENLLPFSELQIDTKYILDQKALPESVYNHIKKYNLPIYEYNAIDAKTRMRFTAYSYELNSTFGSMFIMLVILWLRFHNVKNQIRIRVDNGSEFFRGSNKKLSSFNEMISIFESEVYNIPPGAKHLMGIVENSHRADDEYFLSIHPERCINYKEFLLKAQKWQDTWNTARGSFGIGMYGMTPLEKLRSLKTMIHDNIAAFPVILLEDLIKLSGTVMQWFKYYILKKISPNQAGQYVFTTCQKLFDLFAKR